MHILDMIIHMIILFVNVFSKMIEIAFSGVNLKREQPEL